MRIGCLCVRGGGESVYKKHLRIIHSLKTSWLRALQARVVNPFGLNCTTANDNNNNNRYSRKNNNEPIIDT